MVYDPDVVRSLVKLLSNILRCSSPQVIICSTVRNQETYGSFKQQLGILIYPLDFPYISFATQLFALVLVNMS